ncbi:MAG: hypothetical protein U5Q44_14965 [Dehalococcoidia bacterium]|nr:hypothetical protein [Dehalococcoidia bacterium]
MGGEASVLVDFIIIVGVSWPFASARHRSRASSMEGVAPPVPAPTPTSSRRRQSIGAGHLAR